MGTAVPEATIKLTMGGNLGRSPQFPLTKTGRQHRLSLTGIPAYNKRTCMPFRGVLSHTSPGMPGVWGPQAPAGEGFGGMQGGIGGTSAFPNSPLANRGRQPGCNPQAYPPTANRIPAVCGQARRRLHRFTIWRYKRWPMRALEQNVGVDGSLPAKRLPFKPLR